MSFLLKLLSPVLKWYTHKQMLKDLPNYEANFQLDGLQGNIDIIRDEWAVPHIYASNESDLFFAQGFVHAQDRLWQMDLTKRIVSGRLSEIFGKLTVETDIVLRTLGFQRLAIQDHTKLAQEKALKHIEAYAAGVNAYIAQCKELPVEFKLLKCKPETWKVEDSLAIARFLALQMSFGWLHQIERFLLVERYGLEKAKTLFNEYANENPIAFPYKFEKNTIENGNLKAFDNLFLRPIGGSNNWAIAANKMQDTQSAMLCNDPHLVLNNPNIWFENHLIAPDYEATGVSTAGVPFVLIGHNRKIAWGATLSFIDMQDIYIEKFTGASRGQYEFGESIKKSTQITEEIKIKGKASQKIPITYTHHGVIIYDALGIKGHDLALATPALKDNDMVLGFYQLNKAEGWNDFVNACDKIQAPSLSLAYADTDDNIGYFCTGKIPIRNKTPYSLPLLGYTATQEWQGFIPLQQMPHAFNPEKGYLYTCNHKLVDDNYPYDLGDLWMNGYRANRLESLFKAKKSYTIEDLKAWQNDLFSTAAAQWINLVKGVLPLIKEKSSAKVYEAASILAQWDSYVLAESNAACIYHVLLQELIDLIIVNTDTANALKGKPQKASDIFQFTEFWSHDTNTIYRILNDANGPWQIKDAQATLIQGLENACAYLEKTLGANIQDWQWGKIHQLTYGHILGAQPPFDEIFNFGPMTIGGDKDTLNQLSFLGGKAYGGAICGASFRQITNMGNFDQSYCISPLGQAGNITSPHHHDQMQAWLNGEYKPSLWSKQAILKHKKYRATLSPKENAAQ